MSKIRDMLFHHNKETQRKAREEYSKYIQAVISGTYGELHVLHNCGEKEASLQPQEPVAVEDEDITSLNNNNTNINSNSNDSNGCIIEKRASDVFFDWDPTSSLSQQKIDLQRIRNTRNKIKKDEINGEIIHCKTCDAMFTTQDLIMMALKYHRKHSADNDDDITLPKERQDMAAYLYPYDYLRMLDNQRNEDAMSLLHFANSSASSGVQVNSQVPFMSNLTVRSILLRNTFDEHDCHHRASCFKKGSECRFDLGQRSWTDATTLHFDDLAVDGSNVTRWHRLDQVDSEPQETLPMSVELQRHQGSQFLNAHSIPASTVFGCNSNVRIGSSCHLYYATCYSFKNTQKEDAEKWLIIGTTVIRRLHRMQAAAKEEAAREEAEREALAREAGSGDNAAAAVSDNNDQDNTSDFGKGLGHFLSAMCANISRDVVSSTMAHLTVC